MRLSQVAARFGIVVALLCAPVGAQALPTTPDFSAADQSSSAEMDDLKLIAADEGLAISAAEALYGWQDKVALAATEIEARFVESYAGTEIVSVDPAVVEIRFKGEVPPGAGDVFSNVPNGVNVRLQGGESRSQREVSEFVAAVHASALRSGLTSTLTTEYVRSTDGALLTASRTAQESLEFGAMGADAATDPAARISAALDVDLCRYGHSSGAQCAEVENNNICSTTSSGTACNLTRMKNDEASGGDSGGPWYYGNTAYGFHKGAVGTLLGSRDVFSKATLIDDALGVSVRTS